MRGTRGEIQGYEPFGSLLPGRNYSSDSYRFGFGGKPKDDEVFGAAGTSYDFDARILDPRVGRWMSIDPVVQRYPGYSPYAYVLNSPLLYRDEGGKENFIYLYDLRLQNPKLTQADRTEILKQANEIAFYANSGFVAKGLTPRVIAIGYVPSAGALDHSDMLATIGTAQQTFDFDNSSYVFQFDGGHPNKSASDDQYDVGATVKDVRGWAVNGESTSKGFGMKGNRIALNQVLINQEAGSLDKTPAQYAGWLLQHEAGHAAGIMHSDEYNEYNAPQSDRKEDLMTSGDHMMKDVSRAPSYMDIVSPYLRGLFSQKFTSNPARVNLGRSTTGEGLGPKPMPK